MTDRFFAERDPSNPTLETNVTKREKLAEQAEALARATAELIDHCETARAAIDAAEARRAEDHKKSMAALDAIFDLVDNFSKPKEAAPEPIDPEFAELNRDFMAKQKPKEIAKTDIPSDEVERGGSSALHPAVRFKKTDRPTGIAFVEGVGIREVKP